MAQEIYRILEIEDIDNEGDFTGNGLVVPLVCDKLWEDDKVVGRCIVNVHGSVIHLKAYIKWGLDLEDLYAFEISKASKDNGFCSPAEVNIVLKLKG